MTSPRADLLQVLGIPDDPAVSDDALAVTSALYLGLAAPDRDATTAAVEMAEKIIAGANMTRAQVEDCKLLALKIWQES